MSKISPDDEGSADLWNTGRLHGAPTRKTAISMPFAVSSSNPTKKSLDGRLLNWGGGLCLHKMLGGCPYWCTYT
jgi:hypothetical protein